TRSKRDWSSDVCSSDLNFIPQHESNVTQHAIGLDKTWSKLYRFLEMLPHQFELRFLLRNARLSPDRLKHLGVVEMGHMILRIRLNGLAEEFECFSVPLLTQSQQPHGCETAGEF